MPGYVLQLRKEIDLTTVRIDSLQSAVKTMHESATTHNKVMVAMAEWIEQLSVDLDIKPPDSGEGGSTRWENLGSLRADDEVKLVLASRADYEWACELLESRLRDFPGTVTFQAATGCLEPAVLADWIVSERVAVRFALQLQVVLWPGKRGV